MHYSPDPPFVMDNQQRLSAALRPSRGATPFIFGHPLGTDPSRFLHLALEPVAIHLRTYLPRPPYPPCPLHEPLRPAHWPDPDHAGSSEGKQSSPISTIQRQLESRTAVIYTREMQIQRNASEPPLPDRAHSDQPMALDCSISEQEGVSISPRHRQPWDLSQSSAASPGRRVSSTDALQHTQSDPGFFTDARSSQTQDWEDPTRQEFCTQQILLQQQQLMGQRMQPAQQQQQQQQQQQHEASEQQAESPGAAGALHAMMHSSDGWSLDSCQCEDVVMGFEPDCHEPDPAWWLAAAMNLPPDSLVATEQSESADEKGEQQYYAAALKSGSQDCTWFDCHAQSEVVVLLVNGVFLL